MSDLADLNPDAAASGDDPAPDEAAVVDADVASDDAPATDDAPAPADEVAAAADDLEVAAPEADAPVGADDEAPAAEAITEEALLDEEAPPAVESPYDRPGKWYVVHTQSGYEKKVKQNLEARISSMAMGDQIHEVVIPEEDVVDIRGGKRVTVKKKMFPGYLLVRCKLTDESWRVIRETPGVTGFVGQGNTPSPLPRRDVESFLAVKVEGEDAPKRSKPRMEYEENETVRVKEGPFADFSGTIIEINEDQLKVKVLVNIFGRETPVELEFAQIAKL